MSDPLDPRPCAPRHWSRPLCCVAFALFLLCPAAHARPRGGDGDKAGPVMLNLKLGASIPISIQDYSGNPLNVIPAAFALQLEAGIALDRHHRAYLTLPLELQVGGKSDTGVSSTFVKFFLPVGFQYDIPLPVRGLYLYPRVSLGYAAFYSSASASILGVQFGGSSTVHGGVFTPELGLKYVIQRRFHVGLEPFGLPVHFYEANSKTRIILDYRIHAYGGVNF